MAAGGTRWLGVAGALVAVAVVGACAANDGEVGVRPFVVGEAGPDTAAGLIRRVGNAPFTRTIIDAGEAGESAAVAGELELDLRRLVGAEVEATGRLREGGDLQPVLEVSSYEVTGIDGVRPHVGTLERRDGGYRLRARGDSSIAVGWVSESLREAVGGRVWLILDDRGGVAQFGILRAPDEMAPGPD